MSARVATVAGLLALLVSAHAAADAAIVHVVRPGETLASIGEHYYGDPRRESVLVAENGLTSEGGSAIVVGLRLTIPTVTYHKVVEGETWAGLATRFYGDPTRAFVLIEANGASAGEHPDPGAELLIPYPLRHVTQQGETLRSIAKDYFKSSKGAATLQRFNGSAKARPQRGEIVLVPLANLVLSKEGRAAAEAQGAITESEGATRDKQGRIDDALPKLREHVQQGRYADAVAMANRLVGAGDLSASQVVTIQRELGTALVALGREDLAEGAFAAVLSQQPDLELDGVTTSPKVLAVFRNAQKQLKKSRPADTAEKATRQTPRKKRKRKKR